MSNFADYAFAIMMKAMMKCNPITTFAVVALISAATASAVPVKPGMITVTQSDGTTMQVLPVGDEWHHGLLTDDGLTIARGDDGAYYYRTASGITTMLAHDAALRTAGEQAYVAQNKSQLDFASMPAPLQRARRASADRPRRATQVPNSGAPRVPIILVEYSDKKMSHTVEQFEAHYKTEAKSAYQYFVDQSNGLYTPQFDIYGIYPLSGTRYSYGANRNNCDQGIGRMVDEAIMTSENDIDWSQYDNDGDGEADVCIVVYAGVGEAQASASVPSSIWPCQWSLDEAKAYGCGGEGHIKLNGVTINKFAVFNEIAGSNDNGTTLDGIGTFCHEFSHCLGLPDLYETTYRNGYYGMGNWSILDHGCYNGGEVAGDTPVGYDAYEKNFLGWIALTEAADNTHYTLPVFNSKSAETDQVVKISGLNPNEYWILENRRQQGWDQYIAGQGVLITHITYVPDRWDANTVNNQRVQLATIIPADNSLSRYNEAGDTYGTTEHEFTGSTVPAMKANMYANGTLASTTGGAGVVNKPVTDIYINADGTATLWYVKGTLPSLEAPVLAEATDVAQHSFVASWNHTPTEGIECTYTLQVCHGATVVKTIEQVTTKTCNVTGLTSGVPYTFSVMAVPVDATQATQSAWSNVRSVTLPDEGYLRGDIDGNGVVDINDINILVNIVLGTDSADNYGGRADISGTGIMDVQTINTLVNIVIK